MFYVTMFETDRQYGGPEEGGWYYDTGKPIDHPLNRIFETEDQALAYRSENLHKVREQNEAEGRINPYFLGNKGDFLNLEVHEGIPVPYPTERPYYC